MQNVAFYLIKVIVCSGVFFLYYLLALRNKKFHPYNRFYLLFSAILSCVLPLLHVSMFDVNSNNEKMLKLMQLMYGGTLPDVTVGADKSKTIEWPQIILIVSLIVTATLITLIVVRIIKIYGLKKSFPSTKIEEIDFVNTDIQNAPFSFFRNLFWRNDIELDDETGAQIFRHEMAHIQQKHSWDKLFFQFLSAFYWMNPIFYFMNKELMLIHEFIADEKAVEDGDNESFAKMLLLTQIGKFAFEPAHPFFYSTIKKRLMMITNSQKTKYSYARRLMILPLLGIVSFTFAFRAHRIETKKTEVVLDKMIADIKGQQNADTSKTIVAGNIVTPDTLNTNLIAGRGEIYKIKNGDTIYETTHTFTSVKKESPLRTGIGEPLYIIDGKVFNNQNNSASALQTMSPNDIASITVLKDAKAVSLYGLAAKHGAILITTKSKKHIITQQKNDSIKIVGKQITVIEQADTFSFIKKINITKPNNPLVILNESKSNPEKIKTVNPNSIVTVNILKDANAINKYGQDGKNGVIEITTNPQPQYVFVRGIKADKNNSLPDKIIHFSNTKKDTLTDIVVVGYGSKRNDHDLEFTSVQHEASFPGGAAAWQNYLKKNLKQNIPVDNGAPSGQYEVVVSFLIDKKGNISETKALKSSHPDYGTAAEAVRVIAGSGPWNPAIQNGRPVNYRQKQRIIFTVTSEDNEKKKK